jgi:hypothetical protein
VFAGFQSEPFNFIDGVGKTPARFEIIFFFEARFASDLPFRFFFFIKFSALLFVSTRSLLPYPYWGWVATIALLCAKESPLGRMYVLLHSFNSNKKH